jgi:hypothetical protein
MIYFLGLDPAGPLFYKFDPAVRIDSQDVVFTDYEQLPSGTAPDVIMNKVVVVVM